MRKCSSCGIDDSFVQMKWVRGQVLCLDCIYEHNSKPKHQRKAQIQQQQRQLRGQWGPDGFVWALGMMDNGQRK